MKQFKLLKQITAGVLSMILIVGLTIPADAAVSSSEKEEVVYVMTNAVGNVNDIEVVNIFNGGDVIDFGDYSSVKMLNTNDAITQNGNEITFKSTVEKVYYQGTMKSKEIPWNISIQYILDGKEYSPEEIAGKSGKIEIHFIINKNESYEENFYDNYALQATFTLDRENCSNIQADDATLANVGSDKQLTYTILPGKGIDTTISADATDFQMDAVTINGIKLNLNVDIDDEELMEQVNELMDATKKLNDGTTELVDGSGTLKTGSSTLVDGTESLNNGISTLDNGITALQTGVESMQDGLDTLNSKSDSLTSGSSKMKLALETLQSSLNDVSFTSDQITELTKASSEIKQGIAQLQTGVETLQSNIGFAQYQAVMAQNGLDVATLQQGNTQAIESINTQIASLEQTLASIENVPGYETQVQELQTQITNLQNIVPLLTGNNAAISGVESYLNGLSSAIAELESGVSNLYTKYCTFDEAIVTLANKLNTMVLNLSSLSSGVNEIVSNYKNLDAGITGYTQGVATIVASYQQIVDGVETLALGSKELLNGSTTLATGANDLYSGVLSMYDGTKELSDGADELYTNTFDIDTKVQDQIDEVVSSIQGDDSETVSFVSDRNTNVDSVQFVIKTASIEIPNVKIIENQEQTKMSFWQKLINLFNR